MEEKKLFAVVGTDARQAAAGRALARAGYTVGGVQQLPQADCCYFGAPDAAALAADTLYVGFWTDKGKADADTLDFLQQLHGKRVFLFGTAGFGGSAPQCSWRRPSPPHRSPWGTSPAAAPGQRRAARRRSGSGTAGADAGCCGCRSPQGCWRP